MGSDILTGEVMILWLWKGRITLSACNCETYHEEGAVERLLKVVKENLNTGLGIVCYLSAVSRSWNLGSFLVEL